MEASEATPVFGVVSGHCTDVSWGEFSVVMTATVLGGPVANLW
ncbi:hypothetical protein N803_15465 [Knoellia subterranea KCTC 19937]|uniref:Uncharacterized protein n=1 Tax=Knoellia subterranea KCTC 19937 TaxID=1385521 RepID=A0A0A0JML1_9MICO|nr:hypothetical protein N803_15465 [Knoellia subterranea KCTC 19937]